MSEPDDFYVGYLPLPVGHRRMLWRVLQIVLVVVVGLGVLVGMSQRNPGTGQWDIDKEITLEGTVSVDPYAILHTQDGDVRHAVLLVEEDKFGAAEKLKSLSGKRIQVRGTLLHRGDRNMLEIASAADAVKEVAGEAGVVPAVLVGERTVIGEVIDPKCYIGAMKPGGGKTHKACAELCLAGGIPPMIAAWEEGREVFYLLVRDDDTSANNLVSTMAGETETLTGMVERRDDLLVLKVTAGSLVHR